MANSDFGLRKPGKDMCVEPIGASAALAASMPSATLTNGRRDECLNELLFRSLSAAWTILEAWRIDDNTCRLHTSLGGLTLNAFAARSKQDHNQNGPRL